MIEILDNGEPNIKKLTKSELECFVDIRLREHKRYLKELEIRSEK